MSGEVIILKNTIDIYKDTLTQLYIIIESEIDKVNIISIIINEYLCKFIYREPDIKNPYYINLHKEYYNDYDNSIRKKYFSNISDTFPNNVLYAEPSLENIKLHNANIFNYLLKIIKLLDIKYSISCYINSLASKTIVRNINIKE